jgi:hypothetical protein
MRRRKEPTTLWPESSSDWAVFLMYAGLLAVLLFFLCGMPCSGLLDLIGRTHQPELSLLSHRSHCFFLLMH